MSAIIKRALVCAAIVGATGVLAAPTPDMSKVFHYQFPAQRSEVRAATALEAGDHTIVWELTRNATKGGTGVLQVDCTEVGRVEIERIIRGWAAFSGMDVGCDNGAPVGLGYEAPFRFTGTLHHVNVELHGRVGADPKVSLRTEMGKR